MKFKLSLPCESSDLIFSWAAERSRWSALLRSFYFCKWLLQNVAFQAGTQAQMCSPRSYFLDQQIKIVKFINNLKNLQLCCESPFKLNFYAAKKPPHLGNSQSAVEFKNSPDIQTNQKLSLFILPV
jgi:hypothetical protein